MPQTLIENPIINSPFAEPTRHFKYGSDGITNEIEKSRRISSYIVPIAQPRKSSAQRTFDEDWTAQKEEENQVINFIRSRVSLWRSRGYPDTTHVTLRLLEYWQRPERDQRLFFCQIEALETVIYLTEAAAKNGDTGLETELRKANDSANPGLYRLAMKMATGSGKTVVMAMLIAWHTLNKLRNPKNALFSDSFLVVTPGITIKDRLRVLLPSDPENYYRKWDVVPPDLREEMHKARIIITNFHAFLMREKVEAGKLTKTILRGKPGAFTETPEDMVRRVCRDFGPKANVVVINDEAHHCYLPKPDSEKLTGDERREANRERERASVWINGLAAVRDKLGLSAVYDLSATPFFLKGSGYGEGKLFPWVISDFALIDAIECGIVKVPRVPVADNSMTGDQPTYRDLWLRIRDELPKKGRGTKALTGEPTIPVALEGALRSLYGNYEKHYRLWEEDAASRAERTTPPVFIVVCNNTNVSKLVFDWIAGWEKPLSENESVVVPGQLPIFSNERDGRWSSRPNAILIDSEQLESGDAMSPEFKKAAAPEIAEFKAEYRIRFPGRDPEQLTDEDLLREVMNTVGKPGRLGENVKCVVSVSMLTEGWDANTVTHILGVRAFGSQLLCEQVIGRGLRRRSYSLADGGMFSPEYAEVYGVPFSFIPCGGSTAAAMPGPPPMRVRALEERIAAEITFPRLTGYTWELPPERLTAKFSDESCFALSTQDIPTWTENAPVIGEISVHTLDDLKGIREQQVAFHLARYTLEKYFRDDELNPKAWLFPDLVNISRRWISECVICKDNVFPQLLLLAEFAHNAADRIFRAIVRASDGDKRLVPVFDPYESVGSTRYVDFETTRPVYPTNPKYCHVSHVVADTTSWEQKVAQALEELGDEGLVVSYVKNHNLHFTIPYTVNGDERRYTPDYIVRVDDGHGREDLLNLVLEVSGMPTKDKPAKVATTRTLWIPAVNNDGRFGRWSFLEIADPWDAKNAIRALLSTRP